MKKLFQIFLLPLIVLSALYSCENAVEPGYYDPRIMMTDSNGNIIGGDTTAWCPVIDPVHTEFAVPYAYPNPSKNGKTNIYIINNQIASLMVYFDDGNVLLDNVSGYNFFVFEIDGRKFGYKNTVRKLIVKTSNGQECSGYIQFD